jgi:hypothetical protein
VNQVKLSVFDYLFPTSYFHYPVEIKKKLKRSIYNLSSVELKDHLIKNDNKIHKLLEKERLSIYKYYIT